MNLGDNIHKLRFSRKWPYFKERLEKRSEVEEIIRQNVELYSPRQIDHPPIDDFLILLGQHEAIRYIWFCEFHKRKYSIEFEYSMPGCRVDIVAWNNEECIIVEVINNNWSEKDPKIGLELYNNKVLPDNGKIKIVLALTPNCAKKQKGYFSYSLAEKAKKINAFIWTPDQSLARVFLYEKPRKNEYKPRYYSARQNDDVLRLLSKIK
jgi:hypothetical protein